MKLNSLISEIIQKNLNNHCQELKPTWNWLLTEMHIIILEIQNPILAILYLTFTISHLLNLLSFVLLKDKNMTRPHSNQISFPGGKKELNEALESTLCTRNGNEEIRS